MAADHTILQLGMALLQYGFSSVGMMLGNKLAMDFVKDEETGVALPSTLVIIQVLGTLVLLWFVREHIDQTKLKKECFISWLPIVTLFAGMLYTSAKTFQYVHVSFVIVMRNIGAIVSTVIEWKLRGTSIDLSTMLSELCIVCGTYMYGYGNHSYFKDFWAGSFWVSVNVLCQCLYGVILKMKMDQDPDIKSMSKYTMSLFNNAMCLPYLVVVAIVAGEPASYGSILPAIPMQGWATIGVTCAIGFMISTSGFGLQKLVSATTFIVVNNLTKILNIVLGIAFMGDKLPNPSSLVGCAVSVGGGAWYSYAMMKAAEAKKQQERVREQTPPGLSPARSPAAVDIEGGSRARSGSSRRPTTPVRR
eukprot:TRINITY_DN11036_c0_g1_i1.p1 TRINITY_DN11036_c0_g1~~TRINITY_DN11036_c0_g1_i1.p1  ORF type:complete len:362 (+),score=116.22 TRINITY_DN11036_c0_g1_i1:74-1159(+)